jgi:hypothetical protein
MPIKMLFLNKKNINIKKKKKHLKKKLFQFLIIEENWYSLLKKV